MPLMTRVSYISVAKFGGMGVVMGHELTLGPRRFTNVFDESKINRIRIFAML